MMRVENLSKRFKVDKKANVPKDRLDGKWFQALSNISFDAKSGEVIGLLGANGAGKTTTLRLLSGILKADSGNIETDLASAEGDSRDYRRQLGFLSGSKGLYERLTVRENLNFFARSYGLTSEQTNQQIDKLSQQLNLSDFIDRKVIELSTGMRQRAAIGRALVHDPQLVIFDEPTTGLDIVATEQVLSCIEQQKQAGKTVLFATHHMDEVQLLCDRILVIHQGQRNFFGTEAEFLSQYQADSLVAALRGCLQLGVAK
ncbi:ATP-binding cassette domain-containing protein [Neiella marina]|uniref:ATP-binding cassette domain-containing protein n=1 Tax=Neiella holothuriorum TaxID=2870530 RepID=A0ABS7EKE4_9GAMM|nr:ATP-binding cassette domain-containing protein [Neiella holothuriorum]MBW8192704.1 ATP-binding cassette domain-containing protein [Neiella holothuriorum]